MKTKKEAADFLYRVSRTMDRSIQEDRASFHEACALAYRLLLAEDRPPEEDKKDQAEGTETPQE